MIRCLFAQISRNQRGQPVRKELSVAGETIQIGRAAGCKILLLDHRVNLHHAVIRHSDEGKLFIESEEDANILINGSFGSSAELTPGMHVTVGPYELIAEPPIADYDLALSIEMVRSLKGEDEHIAAKKAPVTLAEAGLSKRKPAFLLVGVIALVSLWFPMMPAISPILPQWANDIQILVNEPWQLGEMSRGHHLMRSKCNTCHQKPFTAVPDKACESCHKKIAGHVKDPMLNENIFKGTLCGECHHDHRGEKGSAALDVQCVKCHANIKIVNSNTKLTDVRDFGTDHPAFSLSLKTGYKDTDVVRILQNGKAKLVEQSGLKFSHKIHLDKKGVSSPEGDTILECRDCHRLDEAGIRFKQISMKTDCQQSGCHALRFKPPAIKRQVPHESVRNVMIALREYHTTTAISKLATGEKLQCGDGTSSGKNQIERALGCANINVSVNANLLFRQDKGCGECHEISLVDNDIPWEITPVTITSHWFRNSRFPHAKHSTAKCTDCHEKTLSEKSSDVAIPAIEKCRECHTGNKLAKQKVSNSCDKCHSFHKGGTHQPATGAIQ